MGVPFRFVAQAVERNPLKVWLAERAEDYHWSSAKAHLTGGEDPVRGALDTCLDSSERAAYAEFVLAEDEAMDEEKDEDTSLRLTAYDHTRRRSRSIAMRR
jgi:hypothetical protein